MLSKQGIDRIYHWAHENARAVINRGEQHAPMLLPFAPDGKHEDGVPDFGLATNDGMPIMLHSVPQNLFGVAHNRLAETLAQYEPDAFALFISECYTQHVDMTPEQAAKLTPADQARMMAEFRAKPDSEKASAVFFSFMGSDWQCYGVAVIEVSADGTRSLGEAKPLMWMGEDCMATGGMARTDLQSAPAGATLQ